MNSYVVALLLFVVVMTSWVTCQTSLEAFEDMQMRPWFGYEPGYGPGWGRKGCDNVNPSCIRI
jgi:hypothetical protein